MEKTIYVMLTVMLAFINAFAQSDFTVTSPSTDAYGGLIKPLKAGGSIQLQVKIKNNTTVTYTVSINKNAMYPQDSWVSIDNNSQSLAPNQTVTFLLTINVPAGTLDGNNYPIPLYFNAYDSNNFNNSFTGPMLKPIVDNTPPLTPNVSVSSKTSSSITIYFNSSDERSAEYTNVNASAGVDGIKSYTLLLKDSYGNTKETYSKDAKDISYYYTFNSLAGYTEYSTFVTAVDVAGNPKTSPGLAARTKVAAPTGITVTDISYCGATVNWTAVNGATSYRVSALPDGTNPITVTSTSLPIAGLSTGTTYSYYISVVGAEGESPRTKVTFSTLSVPTPTFIATDLSMCSNDKTIEVNAIPFTDSYTWTISSPLTINGAQSYTTTNTSVLVHADIVQGQATISVVANLTCGIQSNIKSQSFQLGIPTPTISTKLISASGEPTEFRFTATPYSGAQYSWYVNDGLNQTGLDNTFDWYFPCRVTKTIKCKLTNTCGTSGFSNSSTRTGGCDRTTSYSVSPNPASTTVTISAVNSNVSIESISSETSFDFVKIYDFQGNLKKNVTSSKARNTSINVDNLQVGTYIFEVGNANYSEKHQVVIRK